MENWLGLSGDLFWRTSIGQVGTIFKIMKLKYTAEQVEEAISNKIFSLLEEYCNSEAFLSDLRKIEEGLDVAMVAGNNHILVNGISNSDLMSYFLRNKGFMASDNKSGTVGIYTL